MLARVEMLAGLLRPYQLSAILVRAFYSMRLVSTTPPSYGPARGLEVARQGFSTLGRMGRNPRRAAAIIDSARALHASAREASEVIAEEGMVVETQRGGGRAHPLCAVEREARRSFEMSFRRLGIKL